jgi:hypothetical protein
MKNEIPFLNCTGKHSRKVIASERRMLKSHLRRVRYLLGQKEKFPNLPGPFFVVSFWFHLREIHKNPYMTLSHWKIWS